MTLPVNVTTAHTSTHRKIIAAIHEGFGAGAPFALRDIVTRSGVSQSSVMRTLVTMRSAHLVVYSPMAYAARHYRVGRNWPKTESEAIEVFELFKVLNMNKVS